MRRQEEEDQLNECFVTDFEFTSSTPSIGNAASPLECQLLCQSMEHCSHFTYRRPSKLCFPSDGRRKVAWSGSVSGPRRCDLVVTAISVADQHCLQQDRVCLGSKDQPPGASGLRHQGNVFVGGKPVCDDGWTRVNGEVVCRELSFGGVQQITLGSHFGYTSGHFAMDDVACHGNESSIASCPQAETEGCYGGEAAGVVCDTRPAEVIDAEKKMARYCYVEDVIFWGSLISTLTNMISSPECQKQCQTYPACTHFTLRPAEIARGFQNCDDICLKGGSGPHEGNLIVNNQPVCDYNIMQNLGLG